MNFQLGDSVRIGSTGSVGEIVEICENPGKYRVKWVHGNNIRGELMTSTSWIYGEALVSVDESELQKRMDAKGWYDEKYCQWYIKNQIRYF